jgi:hypothetical protein
MDVINKVIAMLQEPDQKFDHRLRKVADDVMIFKISSSRTEELFPQMYGEEKEN